MVLWSSRGTQNPEEDETTCRTLTTEDLISEELLLPQPEETQQTALIPESVEATAGDCIEQFSSGGTTGAD